MTGIFKLCPRILKHFCSLNLTPDLKTSNVYSSTQIPNRKLLSLANKVILIIFGQNSEILTIVKQAEIIPELFYVDEIICIFLGFFCKQQFCNRNLSIGCFQLTWGSFLLWALFKYFVATSQEGRYVLCNNIYYSTNVSSFEGYLMFAQFTLNTLPRPSEINEKNVSTQAKPFLTSHV